MGLVGTWGSGLLLQASLWLMDPITGQVVVFGMKVGVNLIEGLVLRRIYVHHSDLCAPPLSPYVTTRTLTILALLTTLSFLSTVSVTFRRCFNTSPCLLVYRALWHQ